MPEHGERDKDSLGARWWVAGLWITAGYRTVATTARTAGADTRSWPMDWDEIKPKPATGTMIGENLSTLSVAELEARIAELEKEIARVKVELDTKRRHEDAASALFKR